MTINERPRLHLCGRKQQRRRNIKNLTLNQNLPHPMKDHAQIQKTYGQWQTLFGLKSPVNSKPSHRDNAQNNQESREPTFRVAKDRSRSNQSLSLSTLTSQQLKTFQPQCKDIMFGFSISNAQPFTLKTKDTLSPSARLADYSKDSKVAQSTHQNSLSGQLSHNNCRYPNE